MPTPTLITDLSTTAASNYPAGTDSPSTLDDVQRAHGAFIAQLRDGTGFTAGAIGTTDIADSAVTLVKTSGVAGSGANSNITSMSGLVGAGLLPVGSVIYHAANSPPTGYLKANGALVSRATYAALFTAISTTFGVGDGSTTFALPDLRGEFLRGLDDARGVDSGRAFGSAQLDALQGHEHTLSFSTTLAGGGSGWNGEGGGSSRTTGSMVTNGTNGTPRTASETRPRNVALLACIKF